MSKWEDHKERRIKEIHKRMTDYYNRPNRYSIKKIDWPKAKKLRKKGNTWKQIAKKFDMDVRTLQYKRKKANIPRW